MKPESAPFWGILVAFIFGLLWVWENYYSKSFDQAVTRQFNTPQIKEGSWRIGRSTAPLSINDLEISQLVLYKNRRTNRELVSRIVALPGQRVSIKEGKLLIDGKRADDLYGTRKNKSDFFPELVVPTDSVFLLNDQRWGSASDRNDSRAFGPIPLRAIRLRFSPKEKQQQRRR